MPMVKIVRYICTKCRYVWTDLESNEEENIPMPHCPECKGSSTFWSKKIDISDADVVILDLTDDEREIIHEAMEVHLGINRSAHGLQGADDRYKTIYKVQQKWDYFTYH